MMLNGILERAPDSWFYRFGVCGVCVSGHVTCAADTQIHRAVLRSARLSG